MSRSGWRSGLLAGMIALPLAGCGGGGGGGQAAAFKPYGYAYLTPLRLNVGQIRIEDHVPPPLPDDRAAAASEPPEQALRQMAQDRLVAAGSAGTAVFSIDQASITADPSGNGALDGALAVHLDILGSSGGHAGYAEAHVSRQFVPGTNSGSVQGQLDDLTTRMMQDMNVEFEFQLRRTLADWMVDASGAPVGAAVQQQALPDSPVPAAPISVGAPTTVGAPMPLAPVPPAPVPAPASAAAPPAGPDAVDPTAPVAAPPLSPPPHFLQLPGGATATPGGY